LKLQIFNSNSLKPIFLFFQITGAKLIEWFNSPIGLNFPNPSAGQRSELSPNTIVITTRVRVLLRMIKKDINGAFTSAKSIFNSCFETFCSVYKHFSNHNHFHKLAGIFSSSKKTQQYKHQGRARLRKLYMVRKLTGSKSGKPKPKHIFCSNSGKYLRKILSKETELSSEKSYETISARSYSSTTSNDEVEMQSLNENEASFEILTGDDFYLPRAMTSDAPSEKPSKVQLLSQWDLHTPNMMFENSISQKEAKYPNMSSCWSNSSYEVIATSRSTSKQSGRDEINFQIPSLSISSCSLPETDQHKSFFTPQMFKTSDSQKSSHLVTSTPQVNPYCGVSPNKNQSKQESMLTKNQGSLSTNETRPLNPWKSPKTDEVNFTQIFPKLSTGVQGWSNAETQDLHTNMWDRNRDVPILNSLKKSFDSSFNFDDSRFNSLSPETDQFQINQALSHSACINDSDQKDALCDFSHILNLPTNLQPDKDLLKPRTINSNQEVQDASQFFNNQSLLNSFWALKNEKYLHTNKTQGFMQNNPRRSFGDRLLQLFKSQRDEINNLRTKAARDAIALAEQQALLQDLGKDAIEKAQEVHKRSREKVAQAQAEEILRCNALLDKKVSELVNLQRRCSDAKAHVYKLKTNLLWKPYEM